MKKYMAFPALALLGGGAAFFLRLCQNHTGFEPVTGLPLPGVLWGDLLIGLLALAGAACCLLLRTLPREADDGLTSFAQAFSTRRAGVLFLLTAGVFLLAISGGLEIFGGLSARSYTTVIEETVSGTTLSRLHILQGLFSLVSAVCLFPAVSACRRGGAREAKPAVAALDGTLLLVPVCLLVVRLVLTYRTHSISPTLAAYYVELLAQVFLILALYRLSSFAFQAGQTRRFFLYAVPAILLCMTTLADGHSLAAALFYAGGALILLGFLLMRLEALTLHNSDL